MAREKHLNGLDFITRRKTSVRAFEDMKARRGEAAKNHNPGTSEMKTESVQVSSRGKSETMEVPYFKPRLTVRERKLRHLKTEVSLGDH